MPSPGRPIDVLGFTCPSSSQPFACTWERSSVAFGNGFRDLCRQATCLQALSRKRRSSAKFDKFNLLGSYLTRDGTVSTLGRLYATPDSDGENFSWDSGDEYGPYPWNPSWQTSGDNSVEWVQEDIITLITSEGLVRIGGSKLPRPVNSSSKKRQRLRRFREEDYMDPKQGLCLGSLFDIAATNGLDQGRRFCVFGFCRSVEMLSDVVEDTVLEQGGEVVIAAKFTSANLHEKLKMTVAIPLLWGVPPRFETLHHAIRSGGGIVEKAYYRWEFF